MSLGLVRSAGLRAAAIGGGPAPPTLAGTVLWVRADGDKTLVADASQDRVAQWNDSVGTNHLAQGTVASRPWWLTNQVNSLGVADFRLGQLLLSTANVDVFWTANGTEQAEIWLVLRATTWTTAHIVNINQNATTNALQVRSTNTNLVFAYRTASALTTFNASLPSTGTWFLIRLQKAGTLGAVITAWVNGTQVNQVTDARRYVTISGGATPIQVGARSDVTSPLDGAIAELFVGNQALAAGDVTAMKSYLAAKYGFTIA